MARFFFHLRDGTDFALDPEGVVLPDLEAAQTAALQAARDTLGHDIRDGRLDLRYRIDVEDERGTVLHSLPFEDAFEIIPAE